MVKCLVCGACPVRGPHFPNRSLRSVSKYRAGHVEVW